jgi:hypothetical protein
MNFYELETWRIKPGAEAEHDALIRRWFAYVGAHHADLFPEWESTRYFRDLIWTRRPNRSGSRASWS